MVKYAFFAVGLVLLTVAIVSTKNTRTFVAQASAAHGAVIELVRRQSSDSDTYAPVVHFVTDAGEAVEFTSEASSSPPAYTKGERIDVLYRRLAPHNAKIDDFASLWAGSMIFAALGSIFVTIGGGMIVSGVVESRKAADLKRNGKRILTKVARVELNENLKLNGRNPYRVFTQWKNPATSETRVFESNYVWFDPSAYLNGRDIAVFVGRNDPQRYHVDLSFLPESAN